MPGEEGTWVFLFGDMLVFGVFFGTFMYQRSLDPELFDESRQTLSLGIGLTNTLILLTSSLLVVTAIRAMRVGQGGAARRLLIGAIACGLAFAGLKAIEYTIKIRDGHTPTDNDFYLYYFILTGLHLLHVVVGVIVLTLMTTQARSVGPDHRRWPLVEGGACFWHLVDLLWIVLFPLLYLVS
ncbi:MAG: cytochrome c oxidase, subunit [Aeromicrobium sp.]|nr:cytochrome c oxidase, subunit [Aeromicrobium sp.]